MPPRVALFLPDLPIGGVERVVANLAVGLRRLGADATLVVGDASGPFRSRLPDDLELVDLGVARTRDAVAPLARHLRAQGYDALVAAKEHANVAAVAAARRARTSTATVLTVHSPPGRAASTGLTVAGRRPRALVRWAYGAADAVVAVSAGVADAVAADTGLPRSAVTVIPNPVLELGDAPTGGDDDAPLDPWLAADRDAPVLVAVGRLSPEKDLDVLIDAVAEARRRRPVRLLVVGDGPERVALEARAHGLGLDDAVRFSGPTDRPLAVMAAADGLALSSRWEGLPTVLIEALSVGCPVVATDCEAGPAEILDRGRLGRLVPVGDVGALAEALVATVDDPLPPATPADLAPYRLETASRRYLALVDPARATAAGRGGGGEPTVGLYVVGHDRPDEVADAFASAAGSDLAERRLLDNASEPPLAVPPGVDADRSDENLGVTGARNRVVEGATADLLVFLDDDAVFLGDPVPAVREAFADPRVGAVAFAVRRADGTVDSTEWPFRGAPVDVDRSRPCAYFVGAGYAVRRRALEEVGGYDERYFYSTEEMDLSMRLVAAGWQLRYRADVVVEHRPSTRGRGVRPAVPGLRLRNRVQYARRHLPWPVAAGHVGVWAVRTAREARAASSLGLWRQGLVDGLRSEVDHRPLPLRTLVRVHRLGGRVLW